MLLIELLIALATTEPPLEHFQLDLYGDCELILAAVSKFKLLKVLSLKFWGDSESGMCENLPDLTDLHLEFEASPFNPEFLPELLIKG